ncbi:MAG: DUF4833 domain-containing protein [Myxococcota bacterium]
MRRSGAVLTVALLHVLAAEPSCPTELFRIERSTNANVVLYERSSDERAPVVANWLLLARNGGREPLTLFERAFAYGFELERRGSSFELKLKAFRERVIQLVDRAGCLVATSVIDGRAAVLRRIFVKASGGLAPKVESVDLFGVDAETGEERSERLVRR